MESRKIVYRETAVAAIGVTLCTAVMIAVFVLLDKFDMSVLWGGLMGAVLSIGNFFFMALGTSIAADKAEQQDVAGGTRLVRNSYMLRLLVLFLILILCAKSGVFHLIALVLPQVFVRPTLTAAEFLKKKGANHL